MNPTDPFTFEPIDRVIIARLVIDSRLPDIVESEIFKKVDYVLDVDNNPQPLYVNDNDVDKIYNSLRNRFLGNDRLTNPDSAFMRKIDSLVLDTWNTQSDIENGVATPLVQGEDQPVSPQSAGSRHKRKQTKRKQTKRKKR
jgi:hypothetical protein